MIFYKRRCNVGKFIDITGNKYGRLTVIKRVKNQGKKPMWLCKCECGNEKIARADSLKNGSIQSCGCLLKESTAQRNFVDLTGKKIGRWTVISRTTDQNNCIKWKCQCECGTKRDVFATSLLNGISKSCGCLKNELSHDMNFIDLTGKKFGLLTVIKRVEDRQSLRGGNNVRWLCKCECGNEKIVLSHALRQGCTKSCGCLNVSYGEYYIKELLDEMHIKYAQEYTFNDCKDNKPLPFDFYLPDYNICIEYDGQQHFESVDFFGGKKHFIMQQKHDHIKNLYCKNNSITLLRLPYYLSDNQIKKQIIDTLNP